MADGGSGSPFCDPWWWENYLTQTPSCRACNGYYGPCFGEPVCATCHAFLYASSLENEIQLQMISEEQNSDDDCDSGNDEPSDYLPLERRASVSGTPQQERAGGEEEAPALTRRQEPAAPLLESLADRLLMLEQPQLPTDPALNSIVQTLPPEVLLVIFCLLDDISLYAVGNTCRQWRRLLMCNSAQSQWQGFTRRRWPLFSPLVSVTDWFGKFSALIDSSFCRKCVYQMSERMPAEVESSPLRDKRLGHDLKGLAQDAPEGIEAKPLDNCYYHWQASITGPVGSPYEGGVFYLYLKVPMLYPFRPPEVRFLTKIFHPNVNRHGDIGIDSIQQGNWVSGLTLTKVLISIQSLLTDPYCDVCMEPEVGQLCRADRDTFNAVAREWTWRFAMHDALLRSDAGARGLTFTFPGLIYGPIRNPKRGGDRIYVNPHENTTSSGY